MLQQWSLKEQSLFRQNDSIAHNLELQRAVVCTVAISSTLETLTRKHGEAYIIEEEKEKD